MCLVIGLNKPERISIVYYSWSVVKTFQEHLDFHGIIQQKAGYFTEGRGPLFGLLLCLCFCFFHIGWYTRLPIAYSLIHACIHSNNIY